MADLYLPAPTKNQGPYVDFKINNTIRPEAINLYPSTYKDIPQIWEIHRIIFSLTCTADVANRNLSINFLPTDGGECSKILAIDGPTTAASQTRWLYIGPINYVTGTGVDYQTGGIIGLSYPIKFLPGQYLNIYVGNGENGDVFNGRLLFKYMNRELGMPDPYQDIDWTETEIETK